MQRLGESLSHWNANGAGRGCSDSNLVRLAQTLKHMPKPQDSSIESLKQRAIDVAEAFAGVAAKQPLPVRLAPIAVEMKIKRLRFEPLLSVAGLAEADEGFEIIINTEADGVMGKAPGTIVTWPEIDVDDLHPALRFTIAHEIAHAIVKGGFEALFDGDQDLMAKLGIAEFCTTIVVGKLSIEFSRESEIKDLVTANATCHVRFVSATSGGIANEFRIHSKGVDSRTPQRATKQFNASPTP